MPRMLRDLARDASGASAIEFAILAPLLILMYMGAFVVSDMVTCARKVSLTAHTITDLTTQYNSVATADTTAIMANAAYVLAPYNTANAMLRVSELQVVTSSTATVVWSDAGTGATALAVGTTVNLPANLAPPLMVPSQTNSNTGAYFIMGEISYSYTPAFGANWLPAPNLYNRYFMLPRAHTSVPHT